MKKCLNGKIVEMTAEEIAALEAVQQTAQPRTLEERISDLESENAELREAIKALLPTQTGGQICETEQS